MPWLSWVLAGVALLAVELAASAGFFALFFGAAALVVGGAVAADLAGPAWAQWLAFAALGAAGTAALRGRLQRRLSPPHVAVDPIVGEVAVPLDDLPALGFGRAELRGTPWDARNVTDAPLARGQRCHVAAVDGIVLHLRPHP